MSAFTVRQSGGDYSTLNAAVAASDPGGTISIEGAWTADDTTNVTWNDTCVVTADASSKQIGRPFQSGDTHYRLRPTSGHVFTVTANVDITNLDIQSESSGVSDEIFRSAGSSSITATNCMIGFTGNTDQQDVVYTENSSTKSYNFVQCFFYDVGRSIIDAITGGQTGTVTMNFNSCGSYNIGANGARDDGCWFGSSISTSGATFNVNAHNCLISRNDTYVFAIGSTTPTFNVDCTYSIVDLDTASMNSAEDTEDLTGTVGSYTWTAAADPGAGDRVGLVNITSGTYNPTLTDHANNDAIAFHAVVTDAGLTIPDLDILGQTRDKTTPLFDVGPSAVTVVTGGEEYSGSSAISGFGSILAVALKAAAVGSSVQGHGVVSTLVGKAASGSTSLTGSGSLAAVGSAAESHSGSASLSGLGSIVGTGLKAASATAAVSGVGTVVSNGVKGAIWAGDVATGLDFPGSAAVTDGETVRFKFVNPHTNGLPRYGTPVTGGLTYIWKVKVRQQAGYYTFMFWANDDGVGDLTTIDPSSYYGMHPYPQSPPSGNTHYWEITSNGNDWTNGVVEYDRWYTQAVRVWEDTDGLKHHEYYWDWPNVDAGHKVTRTEQAFVMNDDPPFPTLTFGDAPWQPGKEVHNGILRGLQIYGDLLSEAEIAEEIATPLSSAAGAASIWYLNINPTPSDISDKSGQGHHPAWVQQDAELNLATLYSNVVPGGLSGSGSLVATGTALESHSGTTSVSGSGSLIGTGEKTAVGSSLLSGSGAVVSVGAKSITDSIIATSSGAVTANGVKQGFQGTAISGSGAIAASGSSQESHSGSSSLSASGSLVTAGEKSANSETTLSGAGRLTTNGAKAASGNSTLSSSGTISTAGTSVESHSGSSSLSGAGSLVATGTKTGIGNSSLSTSGRLSALGVKHIGGIISLSGGGYISSAAFKAVFGTTHIQGSGSITTAGGVEVVSVAVAGSRSQSTHGQHMPQRRSRGSYPRRG